MSFVKDHFNLCDELAFLYKACERTFDKRKQFELGEQIKRVKNEIKRENFKISLEREIKNVKIKEMDRKK